MAYHEPLKEFSAERQIRTRRMSGPDDVNNAELYQAVQELREEIAELRRREDNQESVFDEDHPAFSESLAARVEIAQMVKVIGQAKLEIAAIKHPKLPRRSHATGRQRARRDHRRDRDLHPRHSGRK